MQLPREELPLAQAPESPRIQEEGGVRESRLFAEHYPALRRMARARLRRHETFTLLDTTALVHESFMRLIDAPQLRQTTAPAFLAYAGQVMRSVIVDAARARLTQRRGERAEHVDIEDLHESLAEAPAREVLQVDEALRALARNEPRLAEVLRLQYFAGMTEIEVGLCLGLSDRTVRRDADKARLLLRALLG